MVSNFQLYRVLDSAGTLGKILLSSIFHWLLQVHQPEKESPSKHTPLSEQYRQAGDNRQGVNRVMYSTIYLSQSSLVTALHTAFKQKGGKVGTGGAMSSHYMHKSALQPSEQPEHP